VFVAIQFQICIQNRYKLNKKYRKLLMAYGDEVDSLESKAIKAQAKVNRAFVRLHQVTLRCNMHGWLTLYRHIKTAEQRTIIHQYSDWQTGR